MPCNGRSRDACATIEALGGEAWVQVTRVEVNFAWPFEDDPASRLGPIQVIERVPGVSATIGRPSVTRLRLAELVERILLDVGASDSIAWRIEDLS